MKRVKFKKMLFDDSYINWLKNFIENKKSFNNTSFLSNQKINEFDKEMINYLDCLYYELQLFFSKKNITDLNYLCLKIENNYLVLNRYKNYFSCCVHNTPLYIDKYKKWYSTTKDLNYLEQLPFIDYKDLKIEYDLEEIANINNIRITNIETIINKIMDNPQKFYIDIYNNLTPEEKLFIIENLENKNCLNCENNNCEKNNLCNNWENRVITGKSKILRIRDINKLS